MSVITDAEAWDMVQRLDAKANALLKPLAAQLGLDGPKISGAVVELIWDSFSRCDFGRDHYPYSVELIHLTAGINRTTGVVLEPWHVWGLLQRVHKKQKNWGAHRGQGSPYLRDLHKQFGISAEQMKAMGAVPLRMAMATGLGDDVAMTHVITRATNELCSWSNWGDWFDDRFTFNAMLSCRKAGKGVRV
jgi:hypothetical protein